MGVNVPNLYETKYTTLQDGVYIDATFTAFTLCQYSNTGLNNE